MAASHKDPQIIIKRINEGGFRTKIPESIDPNDVDHYKNGAVFLNELAIDSIALHILEQQDETFDNPTPNTVHYSLNQILPDGLTDTYVGFIEHLQISCLTGRKEELNDYIQKNFHIPNLEMLMVSIGKMLENRGEDSEDTDSKKFVVTGRQHGNVIEVNPELISFPVKLLGIGLAGVPMIGITASAIVNGIGSTALEFVTKTTLGTTGFIAGTFSLFLLSKAVKPVKNSVKHTIYHEMAHYISNDFETKRFGLFQLV